MKNELPSKESVRSAIEYFKDILFYMEGDDGEVPMQNALALLRAYESGRLIERGER